MALSKLETLPQAILKSKPYRPAAVAVARRPDNRGISWDPTPPISHETISTSIVLGSEVDNRNPPKNELTWFNSCI
jgi:hypothetical protein